MNLLLLKGAALVGVFFGSFAQREPQVQLQNVRELWQLFEAGKLDRSWARSTRWPTTPRRSPRWSSGGRWARSCCARLEG